MKKTQTAQLNLNNEVTETKTVIETTQKEFETLKNIKDVSIKENYDETEEKENEFDYFNYFKFCLLKGFLKQKFENKDTKNFTFLIKTYNQYKAAWFTKNNAFKLVDLKFIYTDEGKEIVALTIKDLNLEAKATAKDGHEFSVFDSRTIGNALKSFLKSA